MTPQRRRPYDGASVTDSKLSPAFRVLLWDFERGSPAYEVALLVVLLVLLLVPGGLWDDPLWLR